MSNLKNFLSTHCGNPEIFSADDGVLALINPELTFPSGLNLLDFPEGKVIISYKEHEIFMYTESNKTILSFLIQNHLIHNLGGCCSIFRNYFTFYYLHDASSDRKEAHSKTGKLPELSEFVKMVKEIKY